MSPQRIQLSRRKGYRKPPGSIKVDRSTRWGNPFVVGGPPSSALIRKWGWVIPHRFMAPCDCAEAAVARFEACLRLNPSSADLVRSELAGKHLACWCREGSACHGDSLIQIANAEVIPKT